MIECAGVQQMEDKSIKPRQGVTLVSKTEAGFGEDIYGHD